MKSLQIFIPVEKGKKKTSVRGLWRNENGKLFYDYIKVANVYYLEQDRLEKLKKKYNQEAIFYIDTDRETGNIYYDRVQMDILRNRKLYNQVGFFGLKKKIKELLNQYGGLTIYKVTEGIWTLEVWTNENN